MLGPTYRSKGRPNCKAEVQYDVDLESGITRVTCSECSLDYTFYTAPDPKMRYKR